MSACEKCWGDAYSRAYAHPEKSQTEHYRDILRERQDHPCSPAEQRGKGETLDEEVSDA